MHSGQANAGHYYSFIKNRGTNEWFKFNDDTVTSIKMSDQVEPGWNVVEEFKICILLMFGELINIIKCLFFCILSRLEVEVLMKCACDVVY